MSCDLIVPFSDSNSNDSVPAVFKARSASAAHNPLIRGKLTLMLASNEQCRKQPAVFKVVCRLGGSESREWEGVAMVSPVRGVSSTEVDPVISSVAVRKTKNTLNKNMNYDDQQEHEYDVTLFFFPLSGHGFVSFGRSWCLRIIAEERSWRRDHRCLVNMLGVRRCCAFGRWRCSTLDHQFPVRRRTCV